MPGYIKVSHGLLLQRGRGSYRSSGCQVIGSTTHPAPFKSPQTPMRCSFFHKCKILTRNRPGLRIAGKCWMFKLRSSYFQDGAEGFTPRYDAHRRLGLFPWRNLAPFIFSLAQSLLRFFCVDLLEMPGGGLHVIWLAGTPRQRT